MVTATVLALIAAVLHAGWNYAVKVSGDRVAVLWGQFVVAALISIVVLAAFGAPEAAAWPWAVTSGLLHVPYVLILARGYDSGDFSLVYPVARGGGALIAALGGLAFLGDSLSAWQWAGLAVIAAGLLSLARPGRTVAAALWAALLALDIGAYTVADATGARETAKLTYVCASFVCGGAAISMMGVATGRSAALAAVVRENRIRLVVLGAATILVYGLVVIAVRHAPVGYVAALRESSVVVAAFLGWRLLGEGFGRARLTSAVVVLVGLIVLVAG